MEHPIIWSSRFLSFEKLEKAMLFERGPPSLRRSAMCQARNMRGLQPSTLGISHGQPWSRVNHYLVSKGPWPSKVVFLSPGMVDMGTSLEKSELFQANLNSSLPSFWGWTPTNTSHFDVKTMVSSIVFSRPSLPPKDTPAAASVAGPVAVVVKRADHRGWRLTILRGAPTIGESPTPTIWNTYWSTLSIVIPNGGFKFMNHGHFFWSLASWPLYLTQFETPNMPLAPSGARMMVDGPWSWGQPGAAEFEWEIPVGEFGAPLGVAGLLDIHR